MHTGCPTGKPGPDLAKEDGGIDQGGSKRGDENGFKRCGTSWTVRGDGGKGTIKESSGTLTPNQQVLGRLLGGWEVVWGAVPLRSAGLQWLS